METALRIVSHPQWSHAFIPHALWWTFVFVVISIGCLALLRRISQSSSAISVSEPRVRKEVHVSALRSREDITELLADILRAGVRTPDITALERLLFTRDHFSSDDLAAARSLLSRVWSY